MDDIVTIKRAMQQFIDNVNLAHSQNTVDTYGFALRAFSSLLADNKIDIEIVSVGELPEDAIGWFAARLKDLSPATEKLYLLAVSSFYEFLAAEHLLLSPNLPRLKLLVRQRSRRTGQRLPQFPREVIEKVLAYIQTPPLPL